MGKRMRHYLAYYKKITQTPISENEIAREKQKLLVQIQFFQHERLIHLIVTVLFAILTVCSIFITLVAGEYLPLLLALDILFITLLIPYICHYYLLENGVQTLYTYYDDLEKMQEEKHQ